MRSIIRQWLLISCAWLLATSACHAQLNATWHNTNSVSQPIANARAVLTPLIPFADYTATLADIPIYGRTDTNGNVTFTNLIAGYSYIFELDTVFKTIYRTNGFPTGLTGSVAAENYNGVWLPGQRVFAYLSTNLVGNVTNSGGSFTGNANQFGLDGAGNTVIQSGAATTNQSLVSPNLSGATFTGTTLLNGPTTSVGNYFLVNGHHEDIKPINDTALNLYQASAIPTQPILNFYSNDQVTVVASVSSDGTFIGSGAGLTKLSRTNFVNAWDYIYATDYGAKGDGSTDDTAALQAWINDGIARQRNLFLPPSTNRYKITAALNLGYPLSLISPSLYGGWIITGGGQGLSVIWQSNTNANILNFTNTALGVVGLNLEHMTLMGSFDGTHPIATVGVSIPSGVANNQNLIYDVGFINLQQGLFAYIEDSKIDTCLFDDNVIGAWFPNIGSGNNNLTILNSTWGEGPLSTAIAASTNQQIGLRIDAGAAHSIIGCSFNVVGPNGIGIQPRGFTGQIFNNYFEMSGCGAAIGASNVVVGGSGINDLTIAGNNAITGGADGNTNHYAVLVGTNTSLTVIGRNNFSGWSSQSQFKLIDGTYSSILYSGTFNPGYTADEYNAAGVYQNIHNLSAGPLVAASSTATNTITASSQSEVIGGTTQFNVNSSGTLTANYLGLYSGGSGNFQGPGMLSFGGNFISFADTSGFVWNNKGNTANLATLDNAGNFKAFGTFTGNGAGLTNIQANAMAFTNQVAATSAVTNYTVNHSGAVTVFLAAPAGDVCFNAFSNGPSAVTYIIYGAENVLWPTNIPVAYNYTNGLTLSGTNWLYVKSTASSHFTITFLSATNLALNPSLTNETASWSDSAPINVTKDIVSDIPTGSGVSLTTSTAANVTTLSLTPGSWLVSGVVTYKYAIATVTLIVSDISTNSATFNTSDATETFGLKAWTGASVPDSVVVTPRLITVSAPTTVYLLAYCNFSAGSVTAGGHFEAVRQ
jgi:hypothetical protein